MLTYLDTGVLVSAFKGLEVTSKPAIRILSDMGREFIASDFLKHELLPGPAYRSYADELAFYELYFNRAIQYINYSKELGDIALKLACKYDLGAMDSLHVAAAQEYGAKEFITTEKPSKPMHRVVSTVRFVSIHPAWG